jgi:hypothetical protein
MLKFRPRTPQEVKPILQALADAGIVLVVGQAINVWSLLYERPEVEPWRSSRPYTSFDADALADRAELFMAARKIEQAGFQIEVSLPETPEESALNTGLVQARRGVDEISINLLHRLGGLSTQEIRETAVTLSWEGIDIRLLHPLLCVVPPAVAPSLPTRRKAIARRVSARSTSETPWITTAEDSILHKLVWNKITLSERQSGDAAGVFAVQREKLDVAYLRKWADELEVSAELNQLPSGQIKPKRT